MTLDERKHHFVNILHRLSKGAWSFDSAADEFEAIVTEAKADGFRAGIDAAVTKARAIVKAYAVMHQPTTLGNAIIADIHALTQPKPDGVG